MANIDEIYKMLETHSVVLASDSKHGIHIVYYPWSSTIILKCEKIDHQIIYDDKDVQQAVNDYNSAVNNSDYRG